MIRVNPKGYHGHPIFPVGRQFGTGEAWLCPCPMLEHLQNHPMRRKLFERQAIVLWTGKGVMAVWSNSSRNHRCWWFFAYICVILGIELWHFHPSPLWTHVNPMVCSSPCRIVGSWTSYTSFSIIFLHISLPKEGQLWTTESTENLVYPAEESNKCGGCWYLIHDLIANDHSSKRRYLQISSNIRLSEDFWWVGSYILLLLILTLIIIPDDLLTFCSWWHASCSSALVAW